MWGRIVAAVTLGVSFVACALFACSEFSREDPPSASAGADGGSDAGPRGDTTDAAFEDATACSERRPNFDDDFPAESAVKWNPETLGCYDGGISFEPGTSSYCVVLSCASKQINAYRVLITPVALTNRVEIRFAVKLDSSGPSHTFAQFVDFFGPSGNLLFVATSAGIELLRLSPFKSLATWADTAYGGAWREITMVVDSTRSDSFVVSYAGTSRTIGEPRDSDAAALNRRLQLGAILTVTEGVVTDRFDDVRIWSCP
jgi:hypothetical protein